MTIKMQISLAMATIIALLLVIGTAGNIMASRFSEKLVQFDISTKRSETAQSVAVDIYTAEKEALDYRLTGETESIKKMSDKIAQAREKLAFLATEPNGDPERAQLESVGRELDLFETTYLRAVELRYDRKEMVLKEKELGTAVFAQVSDLTDRARNQGLFNPAVQLGGVLSAVEMVGAATEEFGAREDPREAQVLSNALDQLEPLVEGMVGQFTTEEEIALTDQAVSNLNEFVSAARQLISLSDDRIALYEANDKRGNDILKVFRQVVDNALALKAEVGERGQKTASQGSLMVTLISAIGTLAGGILAAWVTLSITRRLSHLTDLMGSMSGGNLEHVIDPGNPKTELGRMRNALIVFQDSARKVQKLTADMASMEELEAERRAAEEERVRAQEKEARAAHEREAVAERELQRVKAVETFQSELAEVLGSARQGVFTQRMPENQTDEALTSLAGEINGLLSVVDENLMDVTSAMNMLAEGQLDAKLMGAKQGAFANLQSDFNSATLRLAETMTQVAQSGSTVSSTAEELEDSSRSMAQSSERNAAQLQETAATVKEMSQNLRQVVQNAQQATQATIRARESAEANREVANATEVAMTEMTEASERIERAVGVIEEIAFQINLLALNAGVEAARAGEAGRGFSVVASEVRALAMRSQDAVQEINSVMTENARSVQNGVEQVDRAKHALEGIIKDVVTTSDQISGITQAVEQQSSGVNDINAALQSIEHAAQTNAAAIEELSANGAALSAEARRLTDSLSQFQSSNLTREASSLSETNAAAA